jgi:hypothetical protein
MLSELAVRQAKAKDKDYKLSDSEGLYLFVAKSGRRSWRFKYRFAGKERRLILGAYPEVSLKAARDSNIEARKPVVWRYDYNNVRPRSSLGNRTPAQARRAIRQVGSVTPGALVQTGEHKYQAGRLLSGPRDQRRAGRAPRARESRITVTRTQRVSFRSSYFLYLGGNLA